MRAQKTKTCEIAMSAEVSTNEAAPPAEKKSKLTNAQKARIERNQAKAQKLREAKLVSHPFKELARWAIH